MTAQWLCSQLSDLYLAGIGLSTFEIKKAYPALLSNGEKDQDSCGTKTLFDVLIAAYLLNPLKNDYEPEDIAKEQLDRMIRTRKQLFEKLSLKEAYAQRPEEFYEYAGTLAYVCYAAVPELSQKLEEAGMQKLFDEIEMPVSRVLYEMEKEGVLVRRQELQAYGNALVDRINELETKIHEAAGCEFNINSPKQLGEILFEKMGLKGGKKTKTGYSTAADILEKLAADNPIVADILEYRGLTKLKSTYADGLADYIEEDGRIHTSFNQTITATGRISSTEPNLQNIPMRTELGRLIRKVFVPKDNYLFTDADYSQIELRVLAHISGDEQLIEAYKSDADIHRITASKVFHTPFEEVTDLQRRRGSNLYRAVFCNLSAGQDISGQTGGGCEAKRLCDDALRAQTSDSGAEIQQFYAAFLWRARGDEFSDSGYGGRYHEACDDPCLGRAASQEIEFQTQSADSRRAADRDRSCGSYGGGRAFKG